MLKKLLFFIFIFSFPIMGLIALEIPPLTSPVVDVSGVLSTNAKMQLSQVLKNYQQQTQIQLQVLMVPSLEGEPIEDYSIRVAERWKLGTKKAGNGVLLLVALKDRQMRIEVGEGLEGDLPDAMAGRIIDHVIAPMFKQKQYTEGIALGLIEIANQLGHPLPELGIKQHLPKRRSRRGLGNLLFLLLMFFLLMGPRMFGGRRSRRGVGGAVVAGLLLGSMMGGGRRGGLGGFGGGWSGGGGGFSGGGASGGW